MPFFRNIIQRYKQLFIYGICLAGLLFTLKWIQWKFLILDHSLDIYVGLIALFFTLLGIWVAHQLIKPKTETVLVEKIIEIPVTEEFIVNQAELDKLNLTAREWEVLQLMARGKSNAEIAENLFLSVSTIKTHASNLFVKMDVRSRTQAIEKSKRLKITP